MSESIEETHEEDYRLPEERKIDFGKPEARNRRGDLPEGGRNQGLGKPNERQLGVPVQNNQNVYMESLMMQQARQIQMLQQQLSMMDPSQQANFMKMGQKNMQIGPSHLGVMPGIQGNDPGFRGTQEFAPNNTTGKKDGSLGGMRDPMGLSMASMASSGSNYGFPGTGYMVNEQALGMMNASMYSGMGNPLQQSSHFIYPHQQNPNMNMPRGGGKDVNNLAKKIDDLFNYNMDALNTFYTAHNVQVPNDYESRGQVRASQAPQGAQFNQMEGNFNGLEDSRGFGLGGSQLMNQNFPGEAPMGSGIKNKRGVQPLGSPHQTMAPPLDKKEFLKKNNFMDDVFENMGSSQRDSGLYNNEEIMAGFPSSSSNNNTLTRNNQRAMQINQGAYSNRPAAPKYDDEEERVSNRFHDHEDIEDDPNMHSMGKSTHSLGRDQIQNSFGRENSAQMKENGSKLARNSRNEERDNENVGRTRGAHSNPINSFDETPLPALKNNPAFQVPDYNDEENSHIEKDESDIPISGAPGKTFEQLVEEQIAEEASGKAKTGPKAVKKPFLKKGTRQFLSSAIHRGDKKKGQAVPDDEMAPSSQRRDSEDLEESHQTLQEKKQPKNSMRTPIPSNPKEKPIRSTNSASTSNIKGNLNEETSASGSTAPVEKKKFLTRGSGVGGGKKKEEATPRSGLKGSGSQSGAVLREIDEGKSKERQVEIESFEAKETGAKLSYDPSHYLNAVKREEEDERKEEESEEEEAKKGKKDSREESGEEEERKEKKNKSEEEMFDDQEEWGEDRKRKEKDEEEEDEEFPKRKSGKTSSKVVEKYFGGEDKPTKPLRKSRNEEDSGVVPVLSKEVEEKIAKKYVNEKIESLNAEVARLKSENERVAKLRQSQEEKVKKLQKEKEEFEKMKNEELARLEEFKQEEMKKIKKERQVAERNSKAIANMPNRKEREEIENLNKEILKLREELKIKEKRNRMNEERMKKQIEELTTEKTELQDQVRQLEQLRLQSVSNDNTSRQPQAKSQKAAERSPIEAPMSKGKPQGPKQEDPKPKGGVKRVGSQSENIAPKVAVGKPKNLPPSSSDEESDNDQKYEDILVKGGSKGANKQKPVRGNPGRDDQSEDERNQESGEEPQDQSDLEAKGSDDGDNSSSREEAGSKEKPKQTSQTKPAEPKRTLFDHDEYKYSSNEHYIWYTKAKDVPRKLVNQTVSNDGKIQKIYADGKKEILFPNGVKREVFNNGFTIVHFANNDIKQTLPDGTVVYYFAEADTTQTTIPSTSTNV